jgi:hypothetical protein
MTELSDFLQALQKDPRLADRLRKRAELDEFKEEYNVEKTTPLKCPSCSQWQMSGGSLWISKDNKNRFVCRKCKLIWYITCEPISTSELIIQMRQATKTKNARD